VVWRTGLYQKPIVTYLRRVPEHGRSVLLLEGIAGGQAKSMTKNIERLLKRSSARMWDTGTKREE